MKQKRIFALFLAAVLLAGLFSACGNPTQEQEDSGEDSAQQDIIDPETVVATAAGGDITWGQVCYWMYYQMSDYYNQYGTTPNLSVEISEGYTYGDSMLETAIDQMVRYMAIAQYAQENNIELVEADTAGVNDYIQKMIDQYGSEEAYEQAVADMNATPEDIRTIQELNFLNQRVFKTIYGPEGDKLSDEALASFAETNGFAMAKIILFLKIDETGEALDAETVANAKSAAEDAAAQLDGWTEASSAYATKEELFTALMNELSEDTELENFPDGYIVGPGDMYEDIYNAILELEEGQISGVVDTDTCYAIIQRIPLDYEVTPYCYKSYAAYGYSYSFRQLAASSMYETQVTGWVDDAQLEKMPVLATIDVAAYFS